MPQPEPTAFYLGRTPADAADPASRITYDPNDLTTHAVLIGMTGSGKTGLLIGMIEEAARAGLPSIVIDPKGDLTNLLLHFPALAPTDFAPWVDPDQARRAGQSLDDLAAGTAARWQSGLRDWGLGEDDIRALERVRYTVYTPGSTAGEPVNLLSSFQAPAPEEWQSARETLRERIASTVTALLGLIGLTEIDPLRSREHILLSNLIERAWSAGKSVALDDLIAQVQTPPIEKLGAFPLESFFPGKDRLELALLLNNFLASPSFQTWMEGTPLDASAFLSPADGTPRCSIFYLAHLGDAERMFFATLLLASVESWMRAQRGTNSLRAILAFDEILGYLPPVANPPSRPVLLRLLKQARAFGLGLVIATQNPTDLNYKALSNAGTWFIGRLQTERDKERLLDGLQSLEGGIDRAAIARLTEALKPRVFLMHNVHQPGPTLFSTRWTMNYLAGPLTRAQMGELRALPSHTAADPAPRVAHTQPVPAPDIRYAATADTAPAVVMVPPPTASGGVATPDGAEVIHLATLPLEKALAAGGSFAGPLERVEMVYRPALLAQSDVRFLNRRLGLDSQTTVTRLWVAPLEEAAPRVDWGASAWQPSRDVLNAAAQPGYRYIAPPAAWMRRAAWSALEKDFLDQVYHSTELRLWVNEPLKLYGMPGEEQAAFARRCLELARSAMQPEIVALAARADNQLEALKRRIEKQNALVDRREEEVNLRKAETVGADVNLLTSLFSRRRKNVNPSLSKRRMAGQAQSQLDEAKKVLADLRRDWDEGIEERTITLAQVAQAGDDKAAQITSVVVQPTRKDVNTRLFALAWVPFYILRGPQGIIAVRGV